MHVTANVVRNPPVHRIPVSWLPEDTPPPLRVFMVPMDTALPVTAMHENMKNRAQEKERPRQDIQNICLVFLPKEQGGARHESEQPYPDRVPHRRYLRSSRRKKHNTVGTPTMTTTQKSITQPICLSPSPPLPLQIPHAEESAQAMPRSAGNIPVSDQSF